MSLLQRTAKYFLLIKAATEIKQRAEIIGIDKVKNMIENGESITEMYLNESSGAKKAEKRREANQLLESGITPEMLFNELISQMPELAPIIEGKDGYIQSETIKIEAFVKGEG